MAYEKYIKKDGKIYGPYLYHSKRVDGKVISEYHGQKKINYKNFLWLALAVFLVILGAYFIGQRQPGPAGTGYSVLDLNANYNEGQTLSGNIQLSLEEGELIPASSTLVFENSGKKYEYSLKEFVSEPTTEGDFFIKDKSISGSGEGFGIPGEKDVYPEVFFTLLISSPVSQEGEIVTESEKKVQGSASSGNTFAYELQEGERAELEPRSVRTSSAQLSDDSVTLSVEEGIISASTTYSEKEKGFGQDFVEAGTKIKKIEINLDKLDFVPEKGDLEIGVFYGGEEIASAKTTVMEESGGSDEGKISAESPPVSAGEETEKTEQSMQTENKEAPATETEETEKTTETPSTAEITAANTTNTTTQTNITKKIPLLSQATELAPEETAALEKEFGNISLEVKQETLKNGFIIITYQLREDTWVNYSYSAGTDNATLQAFMQQDRTKWLKDLAKKYSG